MSLQFIIGSSGAGKSYFAYERVIRESMEHPERNYYIIVPEQFTMQTQKTLVEMHPGKGILNIDILSFERLAYRVFEETGGDNRKVLEDTGKRMVLQKMVQQHRKELAYLGSQMNKPGYLDEVKSLVSEFMQYDIREENLAEMKEKAKVNLCTSLFFPITKAKQLCLASQYCFLVFSTISNACSSESTGKTLAINLDFFSTISP